MKLLNDFNAIVISGLWNSHIFNKDWVAKYIFPGKDLQIEIPLNTNASQRISTDDIRVFVIGNQLNISPINTNTDVLNDIQDISFKIADYLPHTPVTAFGVNFLYEEEKTKVIDNILISPDKENIQNCDYILKSTLFKHSFSIEDSTLNLTIDSVDTNKIRFNFNFHYNINTLIEIKDKLTSHSIIKLKNVSEKLFNDIYSKN